MARVPNSRTRPRERFARGRRRSRWRCARLSGCIMRRIYSGAGSGSARSVYAMPFSRSRRIKVSLDHGRHVFLGRRRESNRRGQPRSRARAVRKGGSSSPLPSPPKKKRRQHRRGDGAFPSCDAEYETGGDPCHETQLSYYRQE